jgi:hypothetical protein
VDTGRFLWCGSRNDGAVGEKRWDVAFNGVGPPDIGESGAITIFGDSRTQCSAIGLGKELVADRHPIGGTASIRGEWHTYVTRRAVRARHEWQDRGTADKGDGTKGNHVRVLLSNLASRSRHTTSADSLCFRLMQCLLEQGKRTFNPAKVTKPPTTAKMGACLVVRIEHANKRILNPPLSS